MSLPLHPLHTATAGRRSFLLTATVAVLAGASASCGRKDRVVPPASSAPPEPVDEWTTAAPVEADTLADLAQRVPEAWGVDLPGIEGAVATQPGIRTLALTFDACGGPEGSGVDQRLLDVLRERAIPTTLFLNSRWITANPDLARQLSREPTFKLENHGSRHCPLSVNGRAVYGITGTADIEELRHEIEDNAKLMKDLLQVESRWFRSGTAHYDDVAVLAVHRLGHRIAGFVSNIDGGATFSSTQVAEQLAAAPDGAICLGHVNQPRGGTAEGVRMFLEGPASRNVNFVHLEP